MMKAIRLVCFAVLVVSLGGCKSNNGKSKSNETERGKGDAGQGARSAPANPLHVTGGLALSAAALPVGVDPLTGVYRLQQTDLSVRFRSVEIDVTREFSSLFVGTEPHNGGWIFYPFQKRIQFVGDKDRFFLQDGADIAEFVRTAGKNDYVSPQGERIISEGEGFIRKHPDGTAETYDRAGKLTGIDSPTGASVRFAYLKERLAKISANDKELLRIGYDRNGRIGHLTAYNGASASYRYDDGGRLVSATNEDNILTRFRYDSRGRLSHVGFQTGDTVGITYEENSGRVLRVIRRGGTTGYAYKESDEGQVRQVIVTHPTGQETYVIRRNGSEVEHTDLLGHRTIRRYENGRLIGQVDAQQHAASYKYDSLGRLAAITSPDGSKAGFAYLRDTSLPTRQTESDGSAIDYTYDDNLRLTRVRSSGGLDVSYTYNRAGLVDTVTYGKSKEALRTQYRYDDNGRLIQETDSLGRTLKYKYDARGRLTGATGPTGATLQYKHDEHGLVSEVSYCGRLLRSYTVDKQLRLAESRDGRGLATRFVYGQDGRLKSVAYPTGAGETYEYNEHGWLVAAVASDGIRRSYKHNKLGVLTAETVDGQDGVGYMYDSFGRLSGLMGRHGAAQWQYDNMGRPAMVVLTGGERRAYAYNRAGRLIAETSDFGGVKKYRYSDAGDLVGVTLPNGNQTQYSYDPTGLGLLTAVRSADGQQYAYAYDAAGRPIREKTPWGQTIEVAYDKADNIIKTTSSGGAVVSYDYDHFGRHVTMASSDGYRAAFEYDDKGDLVRVAGSGFEKKLRYDRFGRLVAEQYPLLGKEVRYAYDKWDRRTSLEVPGHLKIAYSYDKAGRLAAISYGQAKQIAFTYDKAGRRTKVLHANGVAVTYAYAADGGLSQIAWVGPSGQALENHQYQYDAAQRVTKVTDLAGRVRTFRYDVNGQLSEVASDGRKTSFGYGPGLRRLTETVDGKTRRFAHNRAGQMIQAGGAQIAYDREGNMAAKSSAGSKKKYRFDALGKLVQGQSGTRTWTYSYSPEGNRIAKSVGGKKTHYLYDGLDLLMVLDESKQPVNTFIHDPEVDAPTVGLNRSGACFYLLDRLGSIAALADESGRITTRYEYDPFGGFTTKGKGTDNPFAFTGRYYDRESGLYYYRARYYDPTLGIFLSPDPGPKDPERPETFSGYAYVANDPANRIDPLGLATQADQSYARFLVDYALRGYRNMLQQEGPQQAREWLRKCKRNYGPSIRQGIPGSRFSRWLDRAAGTVERGGRYLSHQAGKLRVWARLVGKKALGVAQQTGGHRPITGAGGTRMGPVERLATPSRGLVARARDLFGRVSEPTGGLLRKVSGLGKRALESPLVSKPVSLVKRLPKGTGASTLTGITSYLLGGEIYSSYRDEARAAGRRVSWDDYARASAEAATRAAGAVVTLGGSESITRKLRPAIVAHNRYFAAKNRLNESKAKEKAASKLGKIAKEAKECLEQLETLQKTQQTALQEVRTCATAAKGCLNRISACKPVPPPGVTERQMSQAETNTAILQQMDTEATGATKAKGMKDEVALSHDGAKKQMELTLKEDKAEAARPHVEGAIRAAELATKKARDLALLANVAPGHQAQIDACAAKIQAYQTKRGAEVEALAAAVRQVDRDLLGLDTKALAAAKRADDCVDKARPIYNRLQTFYELVRTADDKEPGKSVIIESEMYGERIYKQIAANRKKADPDVQSVKTMEANALAKLRALKVGLKKARSAKLHVDPPRKDLVKDLRAAASAADVLAARARSYAEAAKQHLASLPGGKEMLARMAGAKMPDGQDNKVKVDPKKKVPPKSYRWPMMLGVKPMYPTTVVRTRSGMEVKTPSGYKTLGKFETITNKYEESKNGFTIFMTVRKFEDEAGAKEMHKYNVAAHKKYFPAAAFRPVFFQSDGTKDGFFFILWGQTTLANDRFHHAGKLKGEFVYGSRYQISFIVWSMGRWKQKVPARPLATTLAPQLLNSVKQRSAILEGHGKRIADWLEGKVAPRKPPLVTSRPGDGGKPSPKSEK